MFEKFGELTSINFKLTEGGEKIGTAFVCYKNSDDA
jgi:hypothetical protein